MKLFILKADNSKEMNKISEDLSQNKFKITQQEKHYILMKKRDMEIMLPICSFYSLDYSYSCLCL